MKEEREKLYKKAGAVYSGIPAYSSLSEHQQLEILKVIIHGTWIEISRYFGKRVYMGRIDYKRRYQAETFEECLAGITNLLWEEMSETSKEKIRKILMGEE